MWGFRKLVQILLTTTAPNIVLADPLASFRVYVWICPARTNKKPTQARLHKKANSANRSRAMPLEDTCNQPSTQLMAQLLSNF